MSKIICFILIFFLVLGFGLVARGQSASQGLPSSAPQRPPTVAGFLPNPLEADTFAEFFAGIMDWVLSLVGLVTVGMIVYGGFQYMISGDVEAKRTDAIKTVRNAIIGLIVVVLAFAFLTAIKEILGITMIKMFIA